MEKTNTQTNDLHYTQEEYVEKTGIVWIIVNSFIVFVAAIIFGSILLSIFT